MKPLLKAGLLSVLALGSAFAAEPDTAKPWTRWWWLGSGVDEKNLTRQLEDFAAAGIGGVEICPIYGAKGYEDRDLAFLSKEWIAMLDHTSKECQRLGLGLDLTTGTGWPFGGPWVTDEMASHSLVPVKKDAAPGKVTLKLPEGELECLRAFPEDGEPIDLTGFVKNGGLDWEAKEPCRILGVVAKSPVQKVKRAAPGGAGNVLDPFSPASIEKYLAQFDAPLKSLKSPQPRAHFHDSFEYYAADWTPDLLDAFRKQHGYDLADHLPALFREGDADEVARVTHDYRETLDQLHRSYLATWHDWANAHGSLTRNQAHGSPGNVLDHYAVADIPETEIFRHVDDEQIPMLQFATSAAHVTGRNLVSAESFTWLGEHFQVKPSALKEAADFLWLGGVNHIFFHGIPYTPDDAEWPGWLFYASTHMGENGGLWHEMPAFTRYIRTVQSELQSGRPDTAVLMYFPVHDLWSKSANTLPLFTVHNQNEWLHGSPFHQAAMTMWNNGIACDYVSDRLLENATVTDGSILLGNASFRTLVIPEHQQMPEATARKLEALAKQGASVVFLGKPPETTPGLPANGLAIDKAIPTSVDLLPHLDSLGIKPEPMTTIGIRFVRRDTDAGQSWFLVNHTDELIDQEVALSTAFTSALFIDPSPPNRSGNPAIKDGKIHLRLQPGESRILRTSTTTRYDAKPWTDFFPETIASEIAGPWTVEFIEGGPKLPAKAGEWALRSWTELGDDARNFSGTARYTTTFTAKAGNVALDLGRVAETCRVKLNGKDLGSSFFPPHRFDVSDVINDGENTLEVEVTNLAANRIADADRRGVEWKAFHEINFVNIDYKPFDASGWKPLPSGLIGPVRLIATSRD